MAGAPADSSADTPARERGVVLARLTGLAAGACTGSIARARRLQRALKAANLWINCYQMLDPALPFSGDKTRGIAREYGIDEVLSFVKPEALVDAFPAWDRLG